MQAGKADGVSGTGLVMDYRLLKLILIDSYSPGRVVEFPVEGGAVLTGRNGRGKTTLLQLIPIFYGEHPSRIVGTETNRLDFNSFYLPRLTSYILFEYQRGDVRALVILHAGGSDGRERRYRFARTPYRPELFVLPDGCNILQAPELLKHFKLQGVILSQAISSVNEYRAIIQGRLRSGKSSQEQRRLAADYACVGRGHHLTHIEKIVSGMFLRRTDFQDLQRMVVSCIADGETEIALSTERRKIATWPDHYAAYTRVMQEDVHLYEILEQEARLEALERELACIHAKLRHLLAHLEAAVAENRHQQAHQTQNFDQDERAHQNRANVLHRQVQDANREAESYERHVRMLDEARADWLARDLPTLAERQARESEWRAKRLQQKHRHEALTGDQRTISIQYDQMRSDLERRASQAESAAARARTDLAQQFEPRLQRLETQARAERDDQQERQSADRQELEGQRLKLVERRGEWTQRAQVPQPDPELVRLLDDKAAVVAGLETEQRTAEAGVKQCRDRLEQARTAHQAHERDLATLRHQQRSLEEFKQQRLLQQTPGEDTLLYFLRRHQPDWVFDIAKVIREELLLRTDLAPEPIETVRALYGVGLELEAVEASLVADESDLRREVVEIEAQCQALAGEIERAIQQLNDVEQERRAADHALTLANSVLQQVAIKLDSARTEEQAAKRRVVHSRQQAGQEAQAQLERLNQELKHVDVELSDLTQRQGQARQALDARHADERAVLENERRLALERHDQAEHARLQEIEIQRTTIEREREQALSAAGVDTSALKRLENEIRETDAQLRDIEQSRPMVLEYQYWLASVWPDRAEQVQRAQAARDQAVEADVELQEESQRWQIRQTEYQECLNALKREHDHLQSLSESVRYCLKDLNDAPLDEQILRQSYDPGWTLEVLSAQANANQRERSKLNASMVKGLNQIKRAFSAERQTPPDDYYESHRAELGPEAPPRAWIAVFKSWFEHEHEAYRRTLAIEAEQIAAAIVIFHRDLERFHRQVQQFNRELQQSLDANLGFESVSRITVEVRSVIRELEYWGPITVLAEEQSRWLRIGGQALPPPEFADALSALLEHWEVREGIRAERLSLIRIQGEVVENGQTRSFRKAADLERVSSHGLSYLILCVIFIAFINRIRRQSQVEIVWALDELKDLDLGNIEALLAILKRNAITLVSAFPDPDPEVLALFRHRFSVEEGRRLLETRVTGWEETFGDA
ncbi:hypothetical protein CKO29_09435 [Allochromatium vinosum]|nr:hypothetical protein [Allochromatium vinosum]